MHAPAPTRTGFTITEVVIVLTLIAITATIAVPRYDGAVARYRADLAARRIVQDIDLARAQARATSGTTAIVFDAAGHGYTLVNVADIHHRDGPYTVHLNASPYHARLKTVKIANGTRIRFNAYGMPSDNAAIALGVGGESRVVRVDAQTGTVTIE